MHWAYLLTCLSHFYKQNNRFLRLKIFRHKSRRARSGTSDRLRSKHHLVSASLRAKKKQSFLELLYVFGGQNDNSHKSFNHVKTHMR